jgi:hypothetical protein
VRENLHRLELAQKNMKILDLYEAKFKKEIKTAKEEILDLQG